MAAVHLRPLLSLALATPPPPTPTSRNVAPNTLHLLRKSGARRRDSCLALLVCSASSPAPETPSSSSSSGGSTARDAAARWAEWIPRAAGGGARAGPEQVLRLISGAAATPVCQFVDSPRTFLHAVDPRVKLVWLLALVVLPARSNIYMRFGLVVFLALLSVWVLPNHVWKDQLGRVALLSAFLFIMLGFGSDGAPSLVQTRTPPPSVLGVPNIPCSTIFLNYIRRIFKNIFDHAEQISKAMIARGFRGYPSNHKIYFLTESSFGIVDLFSLLCLLALMGLASFSDQLI